MDDTDDIIDEIINSPPTKRKETKDSRSLEGTSELRRSTKSVTFVDQDENSDWDSKSDQKKAPKVTPGGKSAAAHDFDDENLPLDTPRSEDSSIGFPDDSPRKTSKVGGGGSGSAVVNAPKMGFSMFVTNNTVSEELVPKSKKKDFDSFLGSLNSNTYAGTSAKDDDDDQLNNTMGGSSYKPWSSSKSSPRSAPGDPAAADIDSVLQSVDLTLQKKRPGTAPAPTAAATENSTKKTLSRLLADDDDELFGTMPPARPRKKLPPPQQERQPPQKQQQPSPPPSPPPSQPPVATETSEIEMAQAVTANMAAASTAAAEPPLAEAEDSMPASNLTRPPTGRRHRGGGGDDLAGLFGEGGVEDRSDALFSMPSIPLSSEMKIELESEIKKLRRERDDLKQHNEQLQQKLKDEVAIIEESYRKKLADTEELSKRREEMLARENEQLKQKYQESQHQLDRQSSTMRSEFNRQLDELAEEKRRGLDQMREQHRQELEALRSAAPHVGALSNLVERLGLLSDKLGSLSDRESAHRYKDEELRQAEAADRRVMHEIVQSLKVRVDESARSERWLNDLATQLMEERRALAAERSELRVLKLSEGSRQADSESERLALADERARLQELEARLRHSRGEVLRQKYDLETLAEELRLKEEKLKDGQKSLEERVEMVSRRERAQREQQARMDAAALEQAELAKRADGMQSRLTELRNKEREVSQALIQLAEERASLDKRAGGLLCANCRTPVRDSALGFGTATGLKLASSADFEFARGRQWDDLEEEKLYLESLSHAPYG